MSIKLMSLVWQTKLKGATKMLLLALADSANDEGVTWPSLNTLAKKCSISRREVCRSLRELIEIGVLSKQPRERINGSNSSNCYFIQLQTLEVLVQECVNICLEGSDLTSPPLVTSRHPPSDLTSPHIITTLTSLVSKETKDMIDLFDFDTKFEEFWKLYPNKKAKPYCKKWFLKNCKNDLQLFDQIISGLKNSIRYWVGREDYIPYPHTWLNKGRWEDEIREDEIHPW